LRLCERPVFDRPLKQKTVRENHEKQVAGLEAEWKGRRVADARAMRADIQQKELGAERQFEEFKRQAKTELAYETAHKAEAAKRAEKDKFRAGETERRQREENRQQIEETKLKSRTADYDKRSEMFLRDEAARAELAGAKAAKERARLEYCRTRQTEIQTERIATEVSATQPARSGANAVACTRRRLCMRLVRRCRCRVCVVVTACGA
jgi:hypothetical protein